MTILYVMGLYVSTLICLTIQYIYNSTVTILLSYVLNSCVVSCVVTKDTQLIRLPDNYTYIVHY